MNVWRLVITTSGVLIVGETNSMACYHLMTEGQSIQLRVWGAVSTPAGPGRCPGGGLNFLKNVLNIGLRKMFEKLTIDIFERRSDK